MNNGGIDMYYLLTLSAVPFGSVRGGRACVCTLAMLASILGSLRGSGEEENARFAPAEEVWPDLSDQRGLIVGDNWIALIHTAPCS